MGINKKWHLKNKMPENPTLDEKVKWHLEHAKNCTCRPLAGKILEEIKKRGLKISLRSFLDLKVLEGSFSN